MEKIKQYFGLILFGMFVLVSCENYLDPEPDGRKTEKEVFNNYQYARGYFAELYNQLPAGFHSIDNATDDAMDDAMEACATDEAKHSDNSSNVKKYNDGSWNKQNFPDQNVYSKYYGALRKLSIFIENVDNAVFVDPNTYNRSPEANKVYQERMKAETFFLRAFYYFELVKRFGGVPIVPERRLTMDDELDIPRSSFDDCVGYIVANCDSAASRLPDSYSDVTLLGHATKASALALKSRILLYAASPLFNENNDKSKWEAALNAAKEVLDIPGYGLLSNSEIISNQMFAIWNNVYNKEILFAMQYSNNNDLEYLDFPVGFEGGKGLTNPTQDLVDAFEMSNGRPITVDNSGYNAANPYNRRDPRLAYFIGYNGQVYNERPVETFVGGLDGLNKDQYATKTGYYLKKFINLSADLKENLKEARRQWIHFRYAEILLNYAEAMNELYGPTILADGYTMTAKEAVDLVRRRVLMPVLSSSITQEEFRDRIKNERRVELCFEGHRFWDVRRWKEGEVFNQPVHGMRIIRQVDEAQRVTYTYEPFEVEKRVFDANKMYLMPIPQSEIIKSKVLEQNPNW
jgi:hypothetical protein